MQSLFAAYNGSILKLNIIKWGTHKIHEWKSAPELTVEKEILKTMKQMSYNQRKQLQHIDTLKAKLLRKFLVVNI